MRMTEGGAGKAEDLASAELLAIKHNAETGGITAPTDVVQLVDTLLGWRRQAIELGAALAACQAGAGVLREAVVSVREWWEANGHLGVFPIAKVREALSSTPASQAYAERVRRLEGFAEKMAKDGILVETREMARAALDGGAVQGEEK